MLLISDGSPSLHSKTCWCKNSPLSWEIHSDPIICVTVSSQNKDLTFCGYMFSRPSQHTDTLTEQRQVGDEVPGSRFRPSGAFWTVLVRLSVVLQTCAFITAGGGCLPSLYLTFTFGSSCSCAS